VGAKMIVHPLGQHVGTVGGGCGEAEVIRAGLDVIELGRPQLVRVDLTEAISMQSTGVCGGVSDVYVERWPPLSESSAVDQPPLLAELLESLENHRSVALLTVLQAPAEYGPASGRRCLVWLDRPPLGNLQLGEVEAAAVEGGEQALSERRSRVLTLADGQVEVFAEVQRRPPCLLIVGAGHVAQPLASLGKLIEFEVAVLDDRPQYANVGRFPQADRVVAGSFQSALRSWPIEADTFVVLVTRGHAQDVECLLEVLNSPARYIGMIGSRRRVRAVFELLAKERGISAEAFRRVYAPIGLDIEAYTPAEIAVSIIAEVIKVYRGGTCPSLSDALRKRTPTS